MCCTLAIKYNKRCSQFHACASCAGALTSTNNWPAAASPADMICNARPLTADTSCTRAPGTARHVCRQAAMYAWIETLLPAHQCITPAELADNVVEKCVRLGRRTRT